MTEEIKPDSPPDTTAPEQPGNTGEPGAPEATDIEFKGRGNKKKKLGKNKRPPKTQVEEQIDEALANSAFQGQKKDQNKLKMKIGGALAVVIVIGLMVNSALQPWMGSVPYGICKVFLENNVRFPTMLRVSTVEEFATSVRIWYTQVDSFGEYRMEPIQCYFKNDEKLGTIIEKITVNRRELNPKRVSDFNRSLPTVIAYPPDLALPDPLPDSLNDLQIDASRFRKPIF